MINFVDSRPFVAFDREYLASLAPGVMKLDVKLVPGLQFAGTGPYNATVLVTLSATKISVFLKPLEVGFLFIILFWPFPFDY